MFRMTVTDLTDHAVVLALYGKITDEAVPLLAQEGTRYRQAGASLILDLDKVTYIDAPGLALLRLWQGAGLELRGGSPFLQALLAAEGLKTY